MLAGALFTRVFGADAAEVLRRRMARGAAGVVALRLVANGLAAVTGIVLARSLRAEGYGTYAFAMAWARLLGNPATVGQDRLLVREVSVYQGRGAWGSLRGLLRWSNGIVLAVSSVLALAAGVGLWATHTLMPRDAPAVYLALALVPVLALTRLRQAALQGLHHVVLGNLPESLFRPALFLVSFLAFRYGMGLRIDAVATIGLMVATTLLAFAAVVWNLGKHLPSPVRSAPPVYDSRAWWLAGLPMMFLSVMAVVSTQLDVLMLGTMRGSATAGVFKVADRGADLVVFVMAAFNVAVAPAMARLYAEGRRTELQRLITRSARAILLVALPTALVLLVFGRWFLLLFGPEFAAARNVLSILVLAQVVSALAGTVNSVLIMTGHERAAAATIGAGTVLNAALNLVLIPRWGATGAAVATLVSVAAIKAAMIVLVYRRTGMVSTGLVSLQRAVAP